MCCHACTRGDTLRLHRPFSLRDPLRVAKGSDHLVAIVQDRQASILIRLQDKVTSDPLYDTANVSGCMHISSWRIPKHGQEPTMRTLGTKQIVAKVHQAINRVVQLRVTHSNNSGVSNHRDSGTAGQDKRPSLFTSDSRSGLESVSWAPSLAVREEMEEPLAQKRPWPRPRCEDSLHDTQAKAPHNVHVSATGP